MRTRWIMEALAALLLWPLGWLSAAEPTPESTPDSDPPIVHRSFGLLLTWPQVIPATEESDCRKEPPLTEMNEPTPPDVDPKIVERIEAMLEQVGKPQEWVIQVEEPLVPDDEIEINDADRLHGGCIQLPVLYADYVNGEWIIQAVHEELIDENAETEQAPFAAFRCWLQRYVELDIDLDGAPGLEIELSSQMPSFYVGLNAGLMDVFGQVRCQFKSLAAPPDVLEPAVDCPEPE